MKFLVLGCNGMAGHMISLYLKEQGHDVTGFARKKSRFVNSIVGDATDSMMLEDIVRNGKFDTVINCIGILNDDADRYKANAVYLNAYLPHFLVEITHHTTTQIIHMSTDCVFSGKRGGYSEYDFPDGKTFYDRSKALGEIHDTKNLTLRNSIIGPDISENGIGLLNWFMKQDASLNGYTKSIWTGQTTLQLAKTIEAASIDKAYGLCNAVPDHSISKYELLVLLNHYFRYDKISITPVDGLVSDKSLIRTNFDFDYIIPDYEFMVKELSVWVRNHKSIYPHYKLY